ncbi:archease [Methanoregula sp.]|uniref:archease n=1 Tax=Methanoregula sp. TaxID=2052170 RepID=UPI0035662A16
MSYEELSHTADVKIRACAPTLEGLFGEACSALMQVMYGGDRRGGTQKTIDLDGKDLESLICDFLSEVLYVTEVDGLVFCRTDVCLDGTHLHAVLDGEPFDPERHNKGTEVKGISYSGMCITRDAKGYMLDILFDV